MPTPNNTKKTNFDELLQTLQKTHPEFSFLEGRTFYWSPRNNTVYYNASDKKEQTAYWSLLHELSHALLNHTNYETDFDLLLLEVSAWEHAKKNAKQYNIAIDEEHVQDCLDTYRDWLHQRSECVHCSMRGIQVNSSTYECSHCLTQWSVSVARFCRPYRRRVNTKK